MTTPRPSDLVEVAQDGARDGDASGEARAAGAGAPEPVFASPPVGSIAIADDYDDFDDEEYDPEGPAFECAGYYPEPAGEFYCPLWGTEECDWECPHGGMA